MLHANQISNVVSRVLWAIKKEHNSSIYAIIDTARAPIVYSRVAESKNQKVCLMIGEQARELAVVAPYLLRLHENDTLSQWLFEQGLGESWCIFAESAEPFIQLRNHFRSLLRVTDDTGKSLFFRYYDPRVLRVFFPTCDPEQLKMMFGPVLRYVVESETGNEVIEYSVTDQFKLVQNFIKLIN